MKRDNSLNGCPLTETLDMKTPKKVYNSPATVEKMLANRKATSLLTSGQNMAMLQTSNLAHVSFAKMGNNIVQGMKPGTMTVAQLTAMPNAMAISMVKQQNFMVPAMDKARVGSRDATRTGPVKASQYMTAGQKLVGSNKLVQRTISSPFEKRVADLTDKTAPIIPKGMNNMPIAGKKTAEGFFTGLRN